jgi:DNA-nicking Smr family endonuclease
MEGRGRKRFLSEEEIELWNRVTRFDEPLARGRGAAHDDAPPTITPEPKSATKTNGSAVVPPRIALPAKSAPSAPPPHQPFDERVSKKIAKGRQTIDARLDLHGLRQHDAHAVLRHFLMRCQADGHRHVLIITGKGGTSDESDRDFWRSEERGVLRRLVPYWLAEPSLRMQVVSFTESALRHGGGGALYVTIRKSPHHRRGA